MNLQRLLHTELGQTFISILLGLGLASLFRKVCTERDCLVIKGPDIKETENNIYAFDGKCYKYKAKGTPCK